MGRFTVSQGNGNAVRVTALLLCSMLAVKCVSAATVQVGGNPGWLLGVKFSNWERDNNVKVQDTLYFKYPAGEHNVVQVSKKDYQMCTAKSVLSGPMTSGADHFTVTKPGVYYFICSIGDHCTNGMKVAVHVK